MQPVYYLPFLLAPYKAYVHGTKTTPLTHRAKKTVKGAYMITALTQLGTTYTQHLCCCKMNPNTIIGLKDDCPHVKILKF
jgi:hypothetical protein